MTFFETRQMGNIHVQVWYDKNNYRAEIDAYKMVAEGPIEQGSDPIVYELVQCYCLMFKFYPPECLFN